MGTGTTIGTLIGAGLGAVAGSVIPGAGTVVGTEAGSSVGGLVGGLFDKGEANKIKPVMPPSVDAQEATFNTELNNLRNNRTTGVASREAIRQLRIAQADSMKFAERASGGSSGALLASVNALNNTYGSEIGKVFSADEQHSNFLDSEYGKSTEAMIARRAGLDATKYGQDLYDKTNKTQEANSNALASGAHIDSVAALLNAFLKSKANKTDAVPASNTVGSPYDFGNAITTPTDGMDFSTVANIV